jgi:hypothetical protein
MPVLLDECIDERLRHSFAEHDCQTVRFAGFAGLKNGALLVAAERAGFDVIITVDQSITNQQNLPGLSISLLVLKGRTNRLADLPPLVPALLDALRRLRRGDVTAVTG